MLVVLEILYVSFKFAFHWLNFQIYLNVPIQQNCKYHYEYVYMFTK